jgi:hypothetical protein
MSSKKKTIKAEINKSECIKLKSFCTTKEAINKQKGNLPNGKRYLQMEDLTRE